MTANPMRRGASINSGHVTGVVLVATLLIALVAQIDNDYYLRIAFTMCTYYLCAAGMNVLVGFAGQKSLGQAGLFAAGAYAVALLTTRTEWDPWLALPLSAVVAAAFGVDAHAMQFGVFRASKPKLDKPSLCADSLRPAPR